MSTKFQQIAQDLILFSRILVCLGLCCITCNQRDQTDEMQRFSEDRVSQAANLIEFVRKNFPVPGLMLSIVHKDSVYYYASGISNSKDDSLKTTTPVFSGNISEPMLATAIIYLAKSGRINLDDPVTKYLPYFKMGGGSYSKVTIRHLLTHSSGIHNYSIAWDRPPYKANATEITTRSIASQVPKFGTPGARVSRSPYNYDILADVISKATGQPFEKYLQTDVFPALGMNASTFFKPAKACMPFKIADWRKFKLAQDTIYPYNAENAGSNGFHTTAKDLATWMKEILNHDLSSGYGGAESEKLLSMQFKTGSNRGIGFGWEIKEENNRRLFYKGSSYAGFTSHMVLLPAEKIGLSILSNSSDGFNAEDIADKIVKWLKGSALVMPRIPVSFVMTKKFDESGSIQQAFKEYYRLKYGEEDKYDLSEAAVNQFGLNLLHHVHDIPRAIEAFRICTEIFPSSVAAHLNLAEACILYKDISGSKAALAKARSLRTDQVLQGGQVVFIEENIEILEEKVRG